MGSDETDTSSPTEGKPGWRAEADPTKEFFITMLTKDITLEDCILDLLDNCVDGARQELARRGQDVTVDPTDGTFKGFSVQVSFDAGSFHISDNCGGISLDDAVNHAFHFGRRKDSPSRGDYSIGLYGIGMKRAVFKLGHRIRIVSANGVHPFSTDIDVAEWAAAKEWDFWLDPLEQPENLENGTTIDVELHTTVGLELTSDEFANKLRRTIQRDYAFLLRDGLEIVVCGEAVTPYAFSFNVSDEYAPIVKKWTDPDTGVQISLWAGLAASPPDDDEEEKRNNKEIYGWHVVCNGRSVLSGNKDDQSVFGWDSTPSWHSQYSGFVGIIRLDHPSRPDLLPWGTTKRQVDPSNDLYKRLRPEMQEPTVQYIRYTNARKKNLDEAKAKERASTAVPISDIGRSSKIKLPKVASSGVRQTSIQFSRPKPEVDKAKRALESLYGEKRLSNSKAGSLMFDYFCSAEVDD